MLFQSAPCRRLTFIDVRRAFDVIRAAANFLLLSAGCAAALAVPSAEKSTAAEPPDLKQAAQALRDQLPEVALAKLERLLAQPKLESSLRRSASVRLAEAALRCGKPERAAAALPNPASPEERFWKAAALQSLGRLTEADQLLSEWPTDATGPLDEEAAFNRASIALALQHREKAASILEPLAKSTTSRVSQRALLWLVEVHWLGNDLAAVRTGIAELEKAPLQSPFAEQLRYLKGRLALQDEKLTEALAFFTSVAGSKSAGTELAQAATIGLAKVQRLSGDKASAARTLGAFVTSSPESRLLDNAFAEIILCNTPPVAELNKILESWVTETNPVISPYARLALIAASEAADQFEVAVQRCKDFVMRHGASPLLPRVVLQEARLLIRQGRLPDAIALLEETKAKAPPEFGALAAEMEAYARLRNCEFSQAARLFNEAARAAPEPEQRLLAAFNGALASLQAGQMTDAIAMIDSLPVATKNFQADLLLERGLYAAAQGGPDADKLLATFLDSSPEHPRAFEAAIARAELALTATEFDIAGIRDKLRAAAQIAKTLDEQERLAVLELRIDSLTLDPELVAKKTTAFLEGHPESPWKAELLMRSGEALYNAQQYGAAKADFLRLAEELPDSPLIDTALFWAGKAALGSMAKGCEVEALKLWDKVAKGNGPLKVNARIEQAKLNQRRDPAAALQLFDAILKDEPAPDRETRFAVLCLKGETLLARDAGKSDQPKAALECFDAVIQTPEVPANWKQQALVRKGVALEQLQHSGPALEAYYEAMNVHSPESAPPGGDLFWFFRAGEKAIRLIESMPRPDWRGAVSIANRLGEAPGPQGAAARAKASRLATEHFIYDAEQ